MNILVQTIDGIHWPFVSPKGDHIKIVARSDGLLGKNEFAFDEPEDFSAARADAQNFLRTSNSRVPKIGFRKS